MSVTGRVRTADGEPLSGVVVSLKDANNRRSSTNSAGTFSMKDVPAEGILVFNHSGMETKEVPLGGRTDIDVTMEEASEAIDEVVVTAFATQKRINVTGAISTISGREVTASPVANVTTALVGSTPGVIGMQTSGEPGRNAASLLIRGVSTYGNSTPLVVIDGIEQPAEQAFQQINSMDPNEILGISVLKDASSTAVYGIRAANGVVIVTTKRGSEGKPVISFTGNFGLTQAANLQKSVSSHDWAYMRNEAIRHEMDSYNNLGLSMNIYSQKDLWKFRNNRDYTPDEVNAMNLTEAQKQALMNSPALYYGSKDMYGDQFGSLAPQMQANISVSGGSKYLKYYTSIGYFKQDGITRDDKYYGARTGSKFDRYNFRSNFDIDALKNLRISVNVAGQFGMFEGPGNTDDPFDLNARYVQTMQYVYETNPFMNYGIIDGHLIQMLAGDNGSEQNPLGTKTAALVGNQNAVYNLLRSNSSEVYNSLLDNTIKIEHTLDYLTPGLKVMGAVNFQDNYNRVVVRTPSIPSYTVQRSLADPNVLEYFGGERWQDGLSTRGSHNWNKLYFDLGATWARSFNRHNVMVLALGKGSKYFIPWDENGTNTPSSIMGFVGRVTYDYDSRYMAEFNAGYNGTEQFLKGRRFGFFPAFSVGWVPSSEKFFPKNKWVTFLKARASYGEVGNDGLGNNRRYLYSPTTYNAGSAGYYFGATGNAPSAYYPGITEGTIGNPHVTWERAKKYDIGIEARFFSDRLNVGYDWFREDRSDILTVLATTSALTGVPTNNLAPANVGKTTNHGYEAIIGWRDQINKFGYYIEGHMSFSRNKIIYMEEPENPYQWMNKTGYSIGQRFGYRTDGFYNTLEELAQAPKIKGSTVTLGDIRYVDLNGDGIIDQQDISPIGYPNYPEYHFGLKVGFNYKGFDVRALFNGSANGSFYVNGNMTMPYFKRGGNAWQWQFDGRWTQEKAAAGEKITFPRPTYDAPSTHHNYVQSDFWMFSNDFIKLKNLEVGYTFNNEAGFMKAARISSLRIYLSGNNLVTFQNHMKDLGIDPETTDATTYVFPLTRIFNIGLSVQF